jgi:hypothetical protein
VVFDVTTRRGRDPRRMTADELRVMSYEPMSVIDALRTRCIDCCGGSADEVRKCVAMASSSWPFRMGKNPWRTPISEEKPEALRQRSPFSPKVHKTEGPDTESPSAAPE